MGGNNAMRVDSRGYAITTALSPYRMNDVILDPKGTSVNVELQESRLQVAPRAGAVVPVKFETNIGTAFLLQLSQADGRPVPFAAEVLDGTGRNVGYVGQGGQALVRLSQEESSDLSVTWGDGGEGCQVDWVPSASSSDHSMTAITATCRSI